MRKFFNRKLVLSSTILTLGISTFIQNEAYSAGGMFAGGMAGMRGFAFQTAAQREAAEQTRRIEAARAMEERLRREHEEMAAELAARDAERAAEAARAAGGGGAAAPDPAAPVVVEAPPPPPPPPPPGGRAAPRVWARVEGGGGRAAGGGGADRVMARLRAGNPHAADIAAGIADGLANLGHDRAAPRAVRIDSTAAKLLAAQRKLEGATRAIERENAILAAHPGMAEDNPIIINARNAIRDAEDRIRGAQAEITRLTPAPRRIIVRRIAPAAVDPAIPAARALRDRTADAAALRAARERDYAEATARRERAELALERATREEEEIRTRETRALELARAAAAAAVDEEARRVALEEENRARRVILEAEAARIAAEEIVRRTRAREGAERLTFERAREVEAEAVRVLEEVITEETLRTEQRAQTAGAASTSSVKNTQDKHNEDLSEEESSEQVLTGFENALYSSMATVLGSNYISDKDKINSEILRSFANHDSDDAREIIEGIKNDPDKYSEDFIKKIQDTGLNFDVDVLKSAKDDAITDKSQQALLYAASLALLTHEQRVIEKEKIESISKLSSLTSESISSLSNSITARLSSINVSFAKPEVGVAAGESGVSAGDDDEKRPKKLWAMGLIGSSKQDNNGNTSGYKGSLLGGTLGFDFDLQDNLTLGIAYSNIISSFNYTNNKSGDVIKARTHGLSLYGKFSANNGIVWQNIASGLISKVDNTRQNKNMNFVAKGKAENKALSFETNLGYSIPMQNLMFIPNVGLRYIHSDNGGYKEKGAGAHNLTVTSSSSSYLTGIIGGKITFGSKISDSLEIIPEIHGSIEKDLKNKQGNSKVKFGWMNGYFENQAASGDKINNKISYNVGGNILLKSHNIETSIGYNCNFKKKYTSHQGFLKVAIIF